MNHESEGLPLTISELVNHLCDENLLNTQAQIWDRAFTYLQQAGDKARQASADEVALRYYDQALKVVDLLALLASHDEERQAWVAKRQEVSAARAQIDSV